MKQDKEGGREYAGSYSLEKRNIQYIIKHVDIVQDLIHQDYQKLTEEGTYKRETNGENHSPGIYLE